VTHKRTGAKAACKSIAKRKLVNTEDVDDVRREVSILHHLSGHPNIVGLLAAYEGTKHVYIVMDFCSGGELFDRIVERGHYSEKDAAEVFRVMVRTIAHCHNLGVMHRDLKPENFVLATKDTDAPIKAIDFGLSAYFEPGERFRDIVGSAYYVAPEVLKQNYSCEADIWSCGIILYILLSGVPPFWAQSDPQIFDAVRKGVYDLEGDPWPKISASAKGLIKRILVGNPAARMSSEEILNHPWVREDGDAPDTPLDDVVMDRMKKFTDMNKFKKVGMLALAKTLTNEEISGMKQMFKQFDKDNSGTITINELQRGLEKKGAKSTKAELEKMLDAMDVDGNGELDYEEFIAATLCQSKLLNEENVERAFAYFDKDNSGFITTDELKKVIRDFGIDKTAGVHEDEFMNALDKNHDGKIDYDEFLAFMSSNDGGTRGLSSR
jgi:calcium-dependent protein kinase